MSENKQRNILYLMFGIPLLGLLITTAFYFYVSTQGVQLETQNNGILIKPPKQIVEVLSLDSMGKAVQWYHGEKRWSMVVVGSRHCDDLCQKQLYLVRQTHTMLGSDSVRVDMIYLNTSNDIDEATTQLLKTDYAHFKIINADADKWHEWQSHFKDSNIKAAHFFLVDPAGWLMMYYTDSQTYKLIIKDLKFLLKNS